MNIKGCFQFRTPETEKAFREMFPDIMLSWDATGYNSVEVPDDKFLAKFIFIKGSPYYAGVVKLRTM